MGKTLKITITVLICLLVVILVLSLKQLFLINNSAPIPSLDFMFDALYDTDDVRFISENEMLFFDVTDGEVTTGGIKVDNKIVKTMVSTDGNSIYMYDSQGGSKSNLLLSGKCYYVSDESLDIRLMISESVLDCDELILFHSIQ